MSLREAHQKGLIRYLRPSGRYRTAEPTVRTAKPLDRSVRTLSCLLGWTDGLPWQYPYGCRYDQGSKNAMLAFAYLYHAIPMEEKSLARTVCKALRRATRTERGSRTYDFRASACSFTFALEDRLGPHLRPPPVIPLTGIGLGAGGDSHRHCQP